MERLTTSQLGAVILVSTAAPNFLAGVLPSLFTIRTFSDDPEKVKALRQGELVGSTMALALGAGASLVEKTWVPFLACVATVGVFIWQYEGAIRNPINDPATGKPLNMADAAGNGKVSLADGRPR